MLIIPVMYLKSKMAAIVNRPPMELVSEWTRAGAELIHVVDLDVPFAGPSPNLELLKNLKIPFEIEANVKTVDTVEKYLSAGATCVAIGSIAYQKPQFLADLCKKLPGKIGVHIDVRRGKVLIKGWSIAANKTAMDYAEQFKQVGVGTIFYSDSEEEGVFKSTDVGRIRDFLRKAGLPVVHTTDVSSIADFEQLLSLETFGIKGTLFSRSIYEGRIDLENTITFAKEKSVGKDDQTLMED